MSAAEGGRAGLTMSQSAPRAGLTLSSSCCHWLGIIVSSSPRKSCGGVRLDGKWSKELTMLSGNSQYVDVDVRWYSTTTLWIPVNMAEYGQLNNLMMHFDKPITSYQMPLNSKENQSKSTHQHLHFPSCSRCSCRAAEAEEGPLLAQT